MSGRSAGAGGPATRQLAVGEDVFTCIDVGSGQPVLFLHGALGDCRTWQRQCEAISADYRAIAYTQRWFGTGRWREDGPAFGVDCHAADLIAFCEALDAGAVSLVAWSYAGQVALLAARARPELFRRILIYEPGVPSHVTDAQALAAFGQDAQAMFGPIFEAAAAGDLAAAVRRLIDGSAGRPGYFDGQSGSRRQIELDNAHSLPRLLEQTPPPEISCDQLAALETQVTIAWGENTRPVFAIPSRAAARCIGGDGHMEVRRAGHLWPDEEPDEFAAFVGRWLTR